jgi:predicted molibdopterin-dependent oxidoreductase YjgC
MARPAWLILGALATELAGEGAPARTAAEAFKAFAGRVPAFEGIDYEDIGTKGAVINEAVSLTGDRA